MAKQFKKVGEVHTEVYQEVKTKTQSSCFVATAVYGGDQGWQVMRLRQWRDSVLVRSLIGRLFIRVYESIGPGLAEIVRTRDWARRPLRSVLDSLARRL